MFDTHGFTKVDTAKKCFAENFRLYSNDPEKYNLYNGLANLAAALEETQNQVTQIQAAIAHIIQRLP